MFLNISSKKHLGYIEQIQYTLDENRKNLEDLENQLKTLDKTKEQYAIIEENIKLLRQMIIEDEENIRLYSNGEWDKAYEYQLKRMYLDKKIVSENEKDYDFRLKASIERRVKLFEYLRVNNLEKDLEKPIQGIVRISYICDKRINKKESF